MGETGTLTHDKIY